jgi:hypothetical protein
MIYVLFYMDVLMICSIISVYHANPDIPNAHAPFGPASLQPDQELKWLTVFQNPIAGAVFQIPMDSDSN